MFNSDVQPLMMLSKVLFFRWILESVEVLDEANVPEARPVAAVVWDHPDAPEVDAEEVAEVADADVVEADVVELNESPELACEVEDDWLLENPVLWEVVTVEVDQPEDAVDEVEAPVKLNVLRVS